MAGDYEVGYGKPPKHSQFKKGESGNPNGRPKGTKNLKTDLEEELREQMVIREGDRVMRVSKQRAIVKSLIAKTVKGDTRAAATVLNMMMRLLDLDGADEAEQPLSREEREALAIIEARLLQKIHATTDQTTKTKDEEEGR